MFLEERGRAGAGRSNGSLRGLLDGGGVWGERGKKKMFKTGARRPFVVKEHLVSGEREAREGKDKIFCH